LARRWAECPNGSLEKNDRSVSGRGEEGLKTEGREEERTGVPFRTRGGDLSLCQGVDVLTCRKF